MCALILPNPEDVTQPFFRSIKVPGNCMENSFVKIIFIYLQLCAMFFYAWPVLAADVHVIRAMSFGDIVASPTGDVIAIDARFGPDEDLAVLTPGPAIVSGGGSGLVRVVSDTAGQTINITYPESVSLKAVGYPDMVIDHISSRSKSFAVSITDGETIDFNIGGLLHISGVQAGTALYVETITIEVDVINP